MNNNFKLNMKRYHIAIILISTILFSCTGKIQRLEDENRLLAEEKLSQDSLLNEFMNAFNDFEDNLDEIKERENLLSIESANPEMRLDAKERINQDLTMISDLLDQSKKIIGDLEAKLKGSKSKNKQFNRMIANLKKQVAERDASITEMTATLQEKELLLDELKGEVNDLSTRTSELVAQTEVQKSQLDEQLLRIESQTQTLSDQTTMLNTAYFVAGTSKQLKDKKVIVRSNRVNADFAKDAFTPIDITKTFSIPVASKKAKVLTHHPAGSYVFTDNDQDKKLDQLEITNPEEFWRTSKYLVLVLN